jgi:multidrug efflux pump subunit AcrB
MTRLALLPLRRQRTILALLVLLMAVGVMSYFSLPAREDPEITIREAVISVSHPGQPASRMEMFVTRPLEEAVRQMPEIEEIRSSSMTGRTIVRVKAYDRHFDLDQIWDDLRARIAQAAHHLPAGAGRPVVDTDFGDVAVLTLALVSEDFDLAESRPVARHVRDVLQAEPGVRRIDLHGLQDERIYIEIDSAAAAVHGLSAQAVAAMLQARNVIDPGGEIDLAGRRIILRPSGAFGDEAGIASTLLRLPGAEGTIALGDIARIRRDVADPPQPRAYYNGQAAIVLAVSMLSEYSALELGPRLLDKIAQVEAELPAGHRLEVMTYQPEAVARAVYGTSLNVVQTLVIVLFTVIAFLGVRTGLIVGATVPAVMLATLAVMGFAGMTLERMSLATLVIALGLLVDNAIVVAEDIRRRLGAGQPAPDAVQDSLTELALPLLACTLTTIIAFLPLMLSQNVSGEYTRSISMVILITLLASWILAVTVTPMLCARFLPARSADRGPGPGDRAFGWLARRYEDILRTVLRRRGAFMGLMAALLAVAVAGLAHAPQRFFPESDRPQVVVYVDLPSDASARSADDRMQEIFERISAPGAVPGLVDFAGYSGYGGPRFVLTLTPVDPAPNRGFVVLNLESRDQVEPAIASLREMFAAEFPGLMARVSAMFLGPSDSTRIEILVRGPDPGQLHEAGTRIMALLDGLPGAVDIRQNWEDRILVLDVQVDQARALAAGVTSQDIARALRGFYDGALAAEHREGDLVIPVVVRAPGGERASLDRIRQVNVFGAHGRAVPLAQLADIRFNAEHSRIERFNLSRALKVEGRSTRLTAEDMLPLLRDGLAEIEADLAPGHALQFDGVVVQSARARDALRANVPLCAALIALVLITFFNSFRRAAIILLTLPLLLIGVSLALYAFQISFGFMIILGMLALAGILINNGVVLISRIDAERDRGGDDFEAVVRACVHRLRPILIATLTTVIGLLPLIVFRDALFHGMASVIALGLVAGTALTLGVVPVLYTWFFTMRRVPPQ